ncbi:MAG TPA: ACT domain-containing protein [Anaeromyxobacter sp.]|nr:ACT domain-containing protein [Anaeromyxobacter sp.]
MSDLVLTLIGPDHPGIVEAIADPITRHGGNWLESRMAHLAGKFAGILRLEVPAGQEEALVSALRALEASGLKLTIERSPSEGAGEGARSFVLELVGLDRPGIVREISHALAERRVNIEELTTDRTTAPMSGELLFRSQARVTVPSGTDPDQLRERLEQLAGDLMVQITLAAPR